MGIFIKGMEMPESCVLCRLECLYRVHNSVSRSKYCPLVEVKTPHGRLIDGDRFYEEFEPNSWSEGMAVSTYIKNAPTAIEAEVE